MQNSVVRVVDIGNGSAHTLEYVRLPDGTYTVKR